MSKISDVIGDVNIDIGEKELGEILRTKNYSEILEALKDVHLGKILINKFLDPINIILLMIHDIRD